jgi:RHS repeat-associated protein
VTAGQTYNFAYAYNLAGGLKSETLPSGRVITNIYDGANRTNQVTGTLGNGEYHLCQRCWGAAPNNNGTLRGITEVHDGPSYPAHVTYHQAFSYDKANRLLTASDDGGWSRQFAYDPFGNIWMPSFTGIPPQGGTMASVNNYNAATNHINGASYDAAGNLTGLTGMILDYDAENRQKVAYDTIYGLMLYLYDGSGQRIEKKYPDASFGVYVYDAFGQLAAEYYSDVPAPPPCTTCYLSWDHLGSARLVTDQWGNMVSRHDYLPFGEEIASGSAGRNSDFGQPDNVNQKFTGQEHDSELGLDFFNARYFSAGLGRFTSSDPLNAGADRTDPQRWDGYSYVANNPLMYVDPNGKSILQFMSSFWNAISGWGSEKGSGNGSDYNPGFGSGVPLPVMNDRAPLVVRGGATFSVTKTAVADIATKNEPPHGVSSLLSEVTSAVLNKPWVLSWIIPISPTPVLFGIGPAADLE